MNSIFATEGVNPEFVDPLNWERLDTCPLCGSASFRIIFKARDRHYGNPGEFQIAECGSCSVWFMNPMPTIRYLSGAYPQNYYSYSMPSTREGLALKIAALKLFLRRILGFNFERTGDPRFVRPGRMLDLGCGAGAFLLRMKKKGWKVHGVELDSRAAESGRVLGLDIFPGTLEAANLPAVSFDYVRSNHSFEHLHNPQEVLREIKRIIKPDGLLFIGVPNVRGLMSRFFGIWWWYLGTPVHTFGYNPSSLSRLLQQEGFAVKSIRYNSTFAGIFGSLQIYLNRNNGRGSENGWVYRSRVLRVLGHWLARLIDCAQAGDCMEIIARPIPR